MDLNTFINEWVIIETYSKEVIAFVTNYDEKFLQLSTMFEFDMILAINGSTLSFTEKRSTLRNQTFLKIDDITSISKPTSQQLEEIRKLDLR